MGEYYVDGELYHYGVKGQKWGVRRYQNEDGSLTNAGKARQDYKDAKRDARDAYREMRKSGGFGMKGIKKYRAAEKKYNDADMNRLHAKAKYAASKAKNSDKAEKAELKVYAKELKKNGLPGSEFDRRNGGRSERIYDSMAVKKGQDYADKVAKRVEKQTYAEIAVAATVAIGAAFVSANS